MIEQITVFLENSEGRLAALCRTLADANVNMHSLVIADTTDYGVVRIICDDPARALEVLGQADYRAISTKVAAIGVPNVPGGLAKLLDKLDDQELREWYAAKDVAHGWSRPVLGHQIKTRLHEREAAAPSNYAGTLAPVDSELAQDRKSVV